MPNPQQPKAPRGNRAMLIIVSAIAVVLIAAAVAWYVIAASSDSRVDQVDLPQTQAPAQQPQ